MKQFDRGFRLNIGGKEIKSGAVSLRIDFEIERSDKPDPNSAEFSIYGLSESTRSDLVARAGIAVRFDAGYGDDLSTIFFGELRNAEVLHEGPDVITKIYSGDGDSAIKNAMISQTFPKGTTHGSILSAFADALGVDVGNTALFSGVAFETIPKTLSIFGFVAEELDAFCKSINLSYSIQNGALQIHSGRGIGAGPLISPKTGLVGSPQIDARGFVSGTALLLPTLTPGKVFALESASAKGSFLCTRTRHYGDSHANEWYVDFEGRQPA